MQSVEQVMALAESERGECRVVFVPREDADTVRAQPVERWVLFVMYGGFRGGSAFGEGSSVWVFSN